LKLYPEESAAMLPSDYFQSFAHLTLRLMSRDDDLARDEALCRTEYGDDVAPVAVMRQRLENYPYGAFGLFEGEDLVGSLHLWPMQQQDAQDFYDGKVSYNDLWPMKMFDLVDAGGASLWRISNLLIHPRYRIASSHNPVAFLLASAMNSWAESGHLRYPVEVFTTAYTRQSQLLLQRFGFVQVREASQMKPGKPLFAVRADSKEGLFRGFAEHGLGGFFGEKGRETT
jgi:hypothetical protein